jgi:hypothetical protein
MMVAAEPPTTADAVVPPAKAVAAAPPVAIIFEAVFVILFSLGMPRLDNPPRRVGLLRPRIWLNQFGKKV